MTIRFYSLDLFCLYYNYWAIAALNLFARPTAAIALSTSEGNGYDDTKGNRWPVSLLFFHCSRNVMYLVISIVN